MFKDRGLYVFYEGRFHYFGSEAQCVELLKGRLFDTEWSAVVMHNQVHYYWRSRIQ